jgi:tRNA/rRNA methyltransferase
MSNFGFRHLRVVNPYEAAFREARSAVDASEILKSAKEYKSVADAVADCVLVVGTTAARHRKLQHPLKTLDEGARLIRKRLRSSRVALLFGSEKRGLANEDLSHCDWLMRIPTREEQVSMNLGQAVAICLYELATDRRGAARELKRAAAPRPRIPEHAAAGQVERLTATLLDALGASGYLKPRSAAATEEKVRRLVRRLDLSAEDADVVLGMLRRMLWKMRSENRAAE